MINAARHYKNWSSFTFMGRRFLALERLDGWEIYEGDLLEPRYFWMSIENFKKDAKAGKLPEFFPAPAEVL